LARQRAFSAGYAAGLHAAQDDFQAAIKAITTTYDAALEMAKRDAATLGQMFAARMIDQNLSNQPEILLRWIDEGARILATSRTFTLSYNPRYSALITSLEGRLSDRITTWVPANLGQVDFVLSGDGGGIECSWRKALLEGE
jgi:flagellar biosynthesis/type III secretory pathway protein FliH